MKKGYGVFGKAYETMFRNDLHDQGSVDHYLLKNMIFLDEKSYDFLYKTPKLVSSAVKSHDLYAFSKQFEGKDDLETVRNLLDYIYQTIQKFETPFEAMMFGGTEKEILDRGTDWCTDISRVGCTLLQCLKIPSRMVYIADIDKAYHGHAVVEAYIDGVYTMCDFLYGVLGMIEKQYSVYDLLKRPVLTKNIYGNRADIEYIQNVYKAAAVSFYDITKAFQYTVTKPNAYYLRLMQLNQTGKWLMGEDDASQ